MAADTKPVDFVGLGINSLDTVIRLPRFPEFNTKVQVRSSAILPGGQVATAAVACQRWGLRCRYIGKIGDDHAGQLQRESLQHEGLDLQLINTPNCASQQAFILVDESCGERTILWQRSSGLDIEPSELKKEWITGARLLHVDGHPSAPAVAAAKWARDAGMIVTSDLDNLYPGVEELLQHVTVAIGSRDFPERLTGIPNILQSLPEIRARHGCAVVGATLGSDGVITWDGTAFAYCSAFNVQVKDSTGAGDIFHAGLAYALLQGWNWPRTLEFSCAAAGLACTEPGARGGIHPLSDIFQLMEQGHRLPSAFGPDKIGKLRRSPHSETPESNLETQGESHREIGNQRMKRA